jgi:hypothetical protein
MSLLPPLLRHATAFGMRRTSTMLLQKSVAWGYPLPAVIATRFYAQDKSPKDNPAEASKGDVSKDPFSQDIKPAPGSILSQYAVAQDVRLEKSEPESGAPSKREEYVSSTDRKRERMARVFTWGFILGLVGTGVWLGRPLDEEERQRIGWADVPRPVRSR